MVVMSSYLNQANKSQNPNHQVYIAEGIPPTSFYKEQTPVKQQTLSATQPIAAGHINNTNMPEPYMSPGGYYTNNTGFAMSFPNFTAPPPAQWSTGGNNPPPQNFDAMQYSGLNGAPASAVPNAADVAAQNHQYVAPDHLFNQNNTAYQNAFSANPYMNGNWSYFNNPSSFFFPTGTAGDLNLTWGATTTETQNTFLQDLYKPPPPPTELEKNKLDAIKNDPNNPSFEANDASKSVESVEQSLSNFSVSSDKDVAVDNSAGTSSISPQVSLQQNGQSKLLSPPVKPQAPTGQSNAPAKPVSWAAVASKPASNKPPAPVVRKPVVKAAPVQTVKQSYSQNGQHSKGSKQQQSGNRWAKQGGGRNNQNDVVAVINDSHLDINNMKITSPLLKKLMGKYNFNPRELALDFKNARFFIIKSYSEDDIFRSIKYSSWTSTEHGNRRLNDAFREQKRSGVRTPMYLLFSVNSSGHFCGVAEMMSEVDLNIETGIWVQDKWKGRFDVRWIYVKDVPNSTLRYIVLENNENKPVTNSRDTQEVMADKGVQVVKIIHNYKAQTSIFDDFAHYEKRQEEDAKMRSKKVPEPFNL